MSDTHEAASVSQVIEMHAPGLLALEHVVGIGEGLCDAKPCIRIYLAEADQATLDQLPAELEGFPVLTEVSGRPKAGL